MFEMGTGGTFLAIITKPYKPAFGPVNIASRFFGLCFLSLSDALFEMRSCFALHAHDQTPFEIEHF